MSETMLIEPDFSEVKDSVGAGIYKVRIVGHSVDKWTGKDGKKDTPYINWIMETFEEAESKNNGRKVFHKTPISGPGAFRLKDFYKAAMGEELGGSFDPSMLYGRTLELTIGQQKDKPEYTEVKAVKALTVQH